MLVNYYIRYFNKHHGLNVEGFEDDAFNLVKNYSWPGNIRELRNVIEHAFIIESSNKIRCSSLPDVLMKKQENIDDDNFIDVEDIRDSIFDSDSEEGSEYKFNFSDNERDLNFQLAKDSFERQFIETALRVNMGKINQTALKANIPKKLC